MENFTPTPVSELPSLVRYNSPVLLVEHPEKSNKLTEIATQRPLTAGSELDKHCELERVLNAIVPPRIYEEDGKPYIQTVSTTPSTRQDVIRLQEKLDSNLHEAKARERDICPVRREIYEQCFDEILRQIIIDNMDRGLLLVRVRNEMSMCIDYYKALYSSTVPFAEEKGLVEEKEALLLREQVQKLEEEEEVLKEKLIEVELKTEQTRRRTAELRAAEEKKFGEQSAFLIKTGAQLKAQIEGITSKK